MNFEFGFEGQVAEAPRVSPHPDPLPEEREQRRGRFRFLNLDFGFGGRVAEVAPVSPHPDPLPEEREQRRNPKEH